MSDLDSDAGRDSTAPYAPSSKRSRLGFRIINGEEVDERDYYNVHPLVQMIYDEIQDGNEEWEFKSVFSSAVDIDKPSSRVEGLDCSGTRTHFLPESIFFLDKLKSLSITNAQNLTTISRNVGNLKVLVSLVITHLDSLTSLPEEISELSSLETLKLYGNRSLINLPSRLPPNLIKIEIDGTPIRALPDSIGKLQKLRSLKASFHHFSALPRSFGNLNNLEEILTNPEKPFDCPICTGALDLPNLSFIWMNVESLGCLLPSTLGPETLRLNYSYSEDTDFTEILTNFERVFKWQRLEKIEISVSIKEGPDNALTLDAFRAGVFPSLSKAKDLSVDFYRRWLLPDNIKDIFQVSLSELSYLQATEKLELRNMTISQGWSHLEQRVYLENLRSLKLIACEVGLSDLLNLSLPRLEVLSLNLNSNEDLHILCTEWITQMPFLHELNILDGHVTDVSESSMGILKALRLRHMELPLSFEKNDPDGRKLLSLVEACQFLGGSFYFRFRPSLRIRWLMHINEARAKVLGGQLVPECLWPKLLNSATRAFIHKNKASDITAHDAFFTLLRKRAALELFQVKN